jgi:hypothetical protein
MIIKPHIRFGPFAGFLLVLLLVGGGPLRSCKTSAGYLFEDKGSWQTENTELDLTDPMLESFRVCNSDVKKDCLRFDPYAKSLRWENALVLSLLSFLVYDKQYIASAEDSSRQSKIDRPRIRSEQIAKIWGFDSYTYFEHKPSDDGYAIIKHAEFIVVAFRGSDSFADWTQNLTSANRNSTKIKAHLDNIKSLVLHSGYSLAAEAILRDKKLAQAIKAVQPYGKNLPVWLTGHSKGGAMATIMALMLEDNKENKDNKETPEDSVQGHPVQGVLTFGTPKVLGQDAIDLYQQKIPHSWRIIHYKDPIVAIPRYLGIVQKKYSWESRQAFLERDSCKKLDDWPLRFRAFPVAIPGIWEHGLADHRLKHYIECSHRQLHQVEWP